MNTTHPRPTLFDLAVVLALAGLAVLLALGLPTPAGAAPAQTQGTTIARHPGHVQEEINPETIQNGFVTFAKQWATPMAVVGIIMALMAFLFVPLLPEWAAGMKGYIVRALLIVAVIAFVPGLVKMVATIGGQPKQIVLPLLSPMLLGIEYRYAQWTRWYRRHLGIER
jgi:hypothetical protein